MFHNECHRHTFCFSSHIFEVMHGFHSMSAEVYIIVKDTSGAILLIVRQILAELALFPQFKRNCVPFLVRTIKKDMS